MADGRIDAEKRFDILSELIAPIAPEVEDCANGKPLMVEPSTHAPLDAYRFTVICLPILTQVADNVVGEIDHVAYPGVHVPVEYDKLLLVISSQDKAVTPPKSAWFSLCTQLIM